MILFIKNLYHSLDYGIVVIVSDVLDPFDRRHNHTDQRSYCVSQRLVLNAQDLQQELEILLLTDFENVTADKLFYKAFPQLRGNLKSIDSQRKQNFNDPFYIIIRHMLLKFCLVVFDDILTDEFCALNSPFVDDNLMMFA